MGKASWLPSREQVQLLLVPSSSRQVFWVCRIQELVQQNIHFFLDVALWSLGKHTMCSLSLAGSNPASARLLTVIHFLSSAG